MADITYTIVEHDGGWAYKLGDVFSETFPDHDSARRAADVVAREQAAPGETAPISYQDAQGAWHEETAKGDDRPEVEILDEA